MDEVGLDGACFVIVPASTFRLVSAEISRTLAHLIQDLLGLWTNSVELGDP